MIKIAITGPESTGKTTLSKELADHFQVDWFPEYARKYLNQTEGNYKEHDLPKIALAQEEERSKHKFNDNIQLFDTENLVIKIWSVFKYGRVNSEIERLLIGQHYDHYLLCSPQGIEWEEDPLREHPDKREELFELYKKELKNRKLPFTVLEGTLERRLQQSIEIIEDIALSDGGFCV